MLRKPEDRKDWQKDILPSIEETSESVIADTPIDKIAVEVKGEQIVEPVLKVVTKKPVAKKTSAKRPTKKKIEKMDV